MGKIDPFTHISPQHKQTTPPRESVKDERKVKVGTRMVGPLDNPISAGGKLA